MTISVLIDPMFCARQPHRVPGSGSPPPARIEPRHPIDQEILDALTTASEPVGVWHLLNGVAKSSKPVTRAAARAIRQQALPRITALVQSGLVRRIGRGAVTLA
jgi:hypothetical protein